ncbi:MAG: hypothetical protein J7L43_02210 [Candidatus Aenigmarchaeota archaeon]|nr:hypothetical protein [Candidatus Aenigmarchaeota archaeon]
MKGQQQILTPILVVLIMISIITSVYLWGLPIIQKNRDIAVLRKAEDFMKTLDDKIKYVANTQSKDSIDIPDGQVTFDPDNQTITLELYTKGTIYATGAPIYFVRNASDPGVWGVDEPELFWVECRDLGGQYYTLYTLKYRTLIAPGTSNQYKIDLVSDVVNKQIAGKGHRIYIEYRGTKEESGKIITYVGITLS